MHRTDLTRNRTYFGHANKIKSNINASPTVYRNPPNQIFQIEPQTSEYFKFQQSYT